MVQSIIIYLFISILGICKAIPDFSDLPRVPYCQKRGCCSNRNDICAAPILDTTCYCDDFCDRHKEEDCCPDFWSHCKGLEPPPEEIKICSHQGKSYSVYQSFKDNCNLCKCEVVEGRYNETKTEILCESHVCLIESELTNTINQMSDKFGFSASNYSKFWGKTLEDGITLRLGTLQPQKFVLKMHPVRHIYDPATLPRKFDSEEKWRRLTPIQDQKWCGSSWAISTAAVASDRFSIISKGLENVQLSAQHLLSCNNRGQQSCNGGHLDKAWMYIKKYGLVDEQCFPYTGNFSMCTISKKDTLLSANCLPPPNKDRRDKYKVSPAYRLGNETDIMYEIWNSGPVQATMKVYHDFYTYRGGIYKRTDISLNQRTGYHSVRIVGWGEENTYTGLKKYWKVANSWGQDWGENGYFRILRGTNECEIESFVLATWPEIEKKIKMK